MIYEMRTLPGYPVQVPSHQVWRWCSIPLNRVLRIKLTDCCSATCVAPPFSSLCQSGAIGDETLFALGIPEQ